MVLAKETKKLLIYMPVFYPGTGGYATGMTDTVRLLSQTGLYDIHLITFQQLGKEKEIAMPGLQIYRLPPFVNVLKGLTRIIHKFTITRFFRNFFDTHSGFDFLFIDTLEQPAITLKLIKYSKLPPNRIGLRIHGCMETEFYHSGKTYELRRNFALAKKLASKTANIFATTPYYIEYFKHVYCKDNIYLTNKKFGVLPPTLLQSTEICPEQERTLVDLALSKGKLRLFSLFRLSEIGRIQKNPEIIPLALKIIEKTNPALFADIHVLIRADGDHLQNFKNILTALGLNDKFTILPFLSAPTMQYLRQKVDGAILAPRFEGYSLFAAECLSDGCPLILSAGTGASDHIETWGNGLRNGFLINHDFPHSLANAITMLSTPGSTATREEIKKRWDSTHSRTNVASLFAYYFSVYPYADCGRH